MQNTAHASVPVPLPLRWSSSVVSAEAGFLGSLLARAGLRLRLLGACWLVWWFMKPRVFTHKQAALSHQVTTSSRFQFQAVQVLVLVYNPGCMPGCTTGVPGGATCLDLDRRCSLFEVRAGELITKFGSRPVERPASPCAGRAALLARPCYFFPDATMPRPDAGRNLLTKSLPSVSELGGGFGCFLFVVWSAPVDWSWIWVSFASIFRGEFCWAAVSQW